MRIAGSDIMEACPVCGAEYVITFDSAYRNFTLAAHSSGGLICPGTHYAVQEKTVWKAIVCRIERIQKTLKKRIKETT